MGTEFQNTRDTVRPNISLSPSFFTFNAIALIVHPRWPVLPITGLFIKLRLASLAVGGALTVLRPFANITGVEFREGSWEETTRLVYLLMLYHVPIW